MAAYDDVRDTRAWRLAHQLHLRVDLFLCSPDFRYQYPHCDQLCDAASTGPRQIAGGSARLKPREFASCVRAAKRSEREVLRHLESAYAQRLISGDELLINRQLIRRAMKAAAGLIRDLERGHYL